MQNRADGSKINIQKTKGERVWNAFGYFFYLGSIILLAAVWGSLPEKVPAQYFQSRAPLIRHKSTNQTL
ncbi:hypothetical protein DT075_36160 [Bacillus licheniformis]|nr:hypothetical protein DT075_36160 [Bacillus licheniformis]